MGGLINDLHSWVDVGNRIEVKDVTNSVIAGGNINNITMSSSSDNEEPRGWQYTIRVGHNVAGAPTWTTEQIVEEFRDLLHPIGIKGWTADETTGDWEGESEKSTEITIIRMLEDGDVYQELLTVVKMAKNILRQDAIEVDKTDLTGANLVE